MVTYEIKKEFLKRCKENGSKCICRIDGTICPCDDFLENDDCRCGVYIKVE